MHFLASMNPIPPLSAADLAKRLSPDAARDLIEWGPASSPTAQFEMVLSHERSLSAIIQEDSSTPALRDDRPINEYFLLRRLRDPVFEKKVWQFLWGN